MTSVSLAVLVTTVAVSVVGACASNVERRPYYSAKCPSPETCADGYTCVAADAGSGDGGTSGTCQKACSGNTDCKDIDCNYLGSPECHEGWCRCH